MQHIQALCDTSQHGIRCTTSELLQTSGRGGSEGGITCLGVPSLSRITFGAVTPAPRMADCGGLMIGQKLVTPYMPRFETAKVPPV